MDCFRRRNSIERDAYDKHIGRKFMAYAIRRYISQMNHNMPLYVEEERDQCVDITNRGNQVLINVDSTVPEMEAIEAEVKAFTVLFHARLTMETEARQEREREEFRDRVKRYFPLIARILRY
ncbi:hypothetical protein PRIPAC_95542 [Pristionchus pacificus]|uniref:Uncharacterized protein n=1 Tax=Pristionchus pacificus TaxID=54126 RepID=A0A2A6BDP6_PRIPA|nr:hypothetical protein PRIPAC_95542 [Pristionchus pacificus]|eukprot:PDM63941.1 hypothetical protein PRIPAC_49442 [Pristionchus pacificus]